MNLLNPSPYLGWALVLGPAAVTAWRQSPVFAVALVVTFYGVIVSGLALFVVAASTARLLRPRVRRALVLASAVVLAALGAFQLVVGAKGLSAALLPLRR